MSCLLETAFLALALASPDDSETPRKDGATVLTRHGESIVGPIRIESVAVRTPYGLLSVPISEVSRVDFAPAPTREDERRIDEALAEAGGLDSNATAELIRELAAMGPVAYRVLSARTVDEKARPLVDQVLERLGESASRNLIEDVVVAKRFTFVGKVELESLEVGLTYGALRVSRADLERIAFSGAGPAGATNRVLIVKTWTDEDDEYAHVHEFLSQRLKLRLVEFTGHDGKDLARALRGHHVLLVPEMEEGRNAVDGVASEAGPALRKFVKEGGVVVSCGGDVNVRLLSQSGLLECSSAGNSGGQAELAKRHPILQGISGPIPDANATYPISVQGAKKMVALAVSGNGGIVVGVARVGAGAVVYCGWDYYQSQESHQRVLVNALRWGAAGMPGSQ